MKPADDPAGTWTTARGTRRSPRRWLVPLLALTLITVVALGIAGIFLAPILGAVLVLAVVAAMLWRAGADKPPLDPDKDPAHR